MLLYLEKDLDKAYRLDCKARTKCNEPWVTREQFRSLYEDLISLHLEKAEYENRHKWIGKWKSLPAFDDYGMIKGLQ